MENDEFVGGSDDIEVVLESLKFSTIPLLCMTENIQKIVNFTKELLKLTSWQSHGMFMMFVTEKYYKIL